MINHAFRNCLFCPNKPKVENTSGKGARSPKLCSDKENLNLSVMFSFYFYNYSII